nr:hypothetical protein BaRGS_031761 [Batillaria attramentaria]
MCPGSEQLGAGSAPGLSSLGLEVPRIFIRLFRWCCKKGIIIIIIIIVIIITIVINFSLYGPASYKKPHQDTPQIKQQMQDANTESLLNKSQKMVISAVWKRKIPTLLTNHF